MAKFFGTDGATSAGAPLSPVSCPREVENVYWSGHPPKPGGVEFEGLDVLTPEIADLRNRGFADGVPEAYDKAGMSTQFCLFAPDRRERLRRYARRRLAVTARLTPETVLGRGPIGGWTRFTGSFPFRPWHRAAHLSRVVADPEYRGIGGFGMTVAGACLRAAESGCNVIRLVCSKDEPGPYYARLGFDLVRENVLIQVRKGLVVLVDAYELLLTNDAMARLREEWQQRMAEFSNAILQALRFGSLCAAHRFARGERTVIAPFAAIAV